MKKATVYGQGSGGSSGVVNDALLTTAVIKSGNNISRGDLISYDGTEVIKRSIGNDITSGSEYVFNSGTPIYISAVSLSDTKVLVSYRDGSYGKAIVLNIDGTNITSGSEYIFNSGTTIDTNSLLIDNNKVLVSYKDYSNSSYGTSIVLNISGNTITGGSEYVFNSGGNTGNITPILLDTNKVLISYQDYNNSSYGTAIVLNIDGTTITSGSPYVFNSGNTSYISATSLTSTKVLVSYQDASNSYYGTAIVLNISGNTISKGSAYIFNNNTAFTSTVSLTDTKVLVSYRDQGNGNKGTAIVLNISGSTISKGNEFVFNSGDTTYISAISLTSTKVLVSYRDDSNNDYGTSIVLTIDGNTITSGSEYVFNSSSTSYISAVSLSDTKVLVSCYNGDGTSIVLDFTKTDIEGLALKSGTGGETIDIYKF